MTGFEVVSGGSPDAREVAAIAAALAVMLTPDPAPAPPGRWRWSGRGWDERPADWRNPGGAAHPSLP